MWSLFSFLVHLERLMIQSEKSAYKDDLNTVVDPLSLL